MVGYCRSFSLGWRDLLHHTPPNGSVTRGNPVGGGSFGRKRPPPKGKGGKIDLFPVGGGFPWVADNTRTFHPSR